MGNAPSLLLHDALCFVVQKCNLLRGIDSSPTGVFFIKYYCKIEDLLINYALNRRSYTSCSMYPAGPSLYSFINVIVLIMNYYFECARCETLFEHIDQRNRHSKSCHLHPKKAPKKISPALPFKIR